MNKTVKFVGTNCDVGLTKPYESLNLVERDRKTLLACLNMNL